MQDNVTLTKKKKVTAGLNGDVTAGCKVVFHRSLKCCFVAPVTTPDSEVSDELWCETPLGFINVLS